MVAPVTLVHDESGVVDSSVVVVAHAGSRRPVEPGPRRAGSPGTVVAAILLAGVTAVLAARWWTGAAVQPALAGLPDAGALTRFGLPIAQYLHEVGGVAVVGVLFVQCLAARGSGLGHRHMAEMVVRWGWLWVVATAVWMVLTLSDMAGVPVTSLVSDPGLLFLMLGTTRVLAVTSTLWVAILVVMFARRASGLTGTAVLCAVATAGLLPAALTGHAGHHNTSVVAATTTLGVHIVAATLWVGGLLALIVHVRRFPDMLREVLPRFSFAALVCVVAVGISGLVASVLMLDGWAQLWGSSRGQLILVKTVALVALAAFGARHRMRTVGAASSGRLLPLLRLGAAELALMGATIGIAVVLSTTA